MQLIADAGLTAVMMRRVNAVGAIGWWWQYKLLGRSIHGQAQFGLMTRIAALPCDGEARSSAVRPLARRRVPQARLTAWPTTGDRRRGRTCTG
jgi:hypothetical protein